MRINDHVDIAFDIALYGPKHKRNMVCWTMRKINHIVQSLKDNKMIHIIINYAINNQYKLYNYDSH